MRFQLFDRRLAVSIASAGLLTVWAAAVAGQSISMANQLAPDREPVWAFRAELKDSSGMPAGRLFLQAQGGSVPWVFNFVPAPEFDSTEYALFAVQGACGEPLPPRADWILLSAQPAEQKTGTCRPLTRETSKLPPYRILVAIKDAEEPAPKACGTLMQ